MFDNWGRLGKHSRHHPWLRQVQRQWRLVATVVVLLFRDNDDDTRYGLTGRRWDQRVGEGAGVELQ